MTTNYKIGDKDTRPWGMWETIDVQDSFVVKRITVLPQGKISLQKHAHRAEHWVITEGEGIVTLDNTVETYHSNAHIYIPVGCVHRIENQSTSPLVFIEVQTGDLLDENDIIRLEDIYNRI